MKSTREEVYAAIDEERDYQDLKWPLPDHRHTVEEFILYSEDYLTEAKHILSRNPMKIAQSSALHILRKVAAMLVACMEINGALRR